MSHVIIGTAGHIDHGKTALVKAISGIDTDTLPEEQARGMTIDIGFAYWKDNVTIIDVPGHERFVKNMVTGVSTVDLALFVVAADDGPMPQTREHLGILNLLGIRQGIVALTKCDLVEPDWVELVVEELAELFQGTFLEGAPIVPVSSITGDGVDVLRTLIEDTVGRVEARPDRGVFRLPVDRVFSVRGFGTVVTGTVLSGQVSGGDELVLLPSGKSVRVRGVQTHGKAVDVAEVGARAAVNLAGVEVEEVGRGDILSQVGYFETTYMIDGRLHMLPDASVPLKNRDRVHLHLGPREVLARVVLLENEELGPGQTQLVQFRLEEPGVAARGDRFVVRRYSPVTTLGGGMVLDPRPVKHRRFREDVNRALRDLEQDDPTQVLGARLKSAGLRPPTDQNLASEMGVAVEEVRERLRDLVAGEKAVEYAHSGGTYFAHMEAWQDLRDRIVVALETYHAQNPLRTGVQRRELEQLVTGNPDSRFYERGVESLLESDLLKAEGPLVSLADHRIQLSAEQEAVRENILARLKEGFSTPVDLNELPGAVGDKPEVVQNVVAALQAMGNLVRLEETLLFHPDVLQEVEGRLVDFLKANGEIEVSAFRDLVDTTRKYAVPLLNYFDSRGVTVRQGDVRVLKGRG